VGGSQGCFQALEFQVQVYAPGDLLFLGGSGPQAGDLLVQAC
jgi:hypothetical protein